MPLLTDRDRQEIRIGRNRALGAMYARRLFIAEAAWLALKWGVPLALGVWVAVVSVRAVSSAWSGGLGSSVSDDWPLGLLAVLFTALIVGAARTGPSNRRRRRRRRRR